MGKLLFFAVLIGGYYFYNRLRLNAPSQDSTSKEGEFIDYEELDD